MSHVAQLTAEPGTLHSPTYADAQKIAALLQPFALKPNARNNRGDLRFTFHNVDEDSFVLERYKSSDIDRAFLTLQGILERKIKTGSESLGNVLYDIEYALNRIEPTLLPEIARELAKTQNELKKTLDDAQRKGLFTTGQSLYVEKHVNKGETARAA